MSDRTAVEHRVYAFASLRGLMAKATPWRSGNCLTGPAADSAMERIAGRRSANANLRTDPRHQQHAGAAERAPVDRVFQSVGGTQAGNESFGISLALVDKAHAMA